MNRIKISAPATTANFGPGFDVFALALKEPLDIMELEKIDSGIVIENKGFSIPKEPEKNCAGHVALEMLKEFEINEGVRIKIKKQIRPASGLGSSAASVAGVKKLRECGVISRDERVICILTGNILKDPDVTVGYHSCQLKNIKPDYANKPMIIEPEIEDVKAALK